MNTELKDQVRRYVADQHRSRAHIDKLVAAVGHALEQDPLSAADRIQYAELRKALLAIKNEEKTSPLGCGTIGP
jgi:hypothetical protein